MTNQNITDLQWDRLHRDFRAFDRSKRIPPRQSVSTGRNFNGAIVQGHRDQAEADHQHVNGQLKVWNLSKQRVLVVYVGTLVTRAPDRRVTTPLISHHSVAHRPAHDAQHRLIKKELRNKAGCRKWHRKKMAVRPAVRCVAVGFDMGKQNRPKPFSAGVNKRLREMLPENAVAILLDVEEGIFGHRRTPPSRNLSLAHGFFAENGEV